MWVSRCSGVWLLTQAWNSKFLSDVQPISTVKRQSVLDDPICDTFNDDCTPCIG